MTYTTIDDGRAARVAARVPAQPGARRGLPGRGADAVGRRLPDRGRAGRARGPRSARRRYHRLAFHRRRRRRRRRSRRPGPSCCRPASRWSRTPTTSATSRCSARTVRTPLFGVEVPVLAHRARRARQGHRHRDGLHLRRPHRRARGGASCSCRPASSSAATAGSCAEPPDVARPTSRRGGVRRARRHDRRSRRGQRDRRAAAGQRRPRSASRAPITHMVKFYEKGDQPLEIVTHAASGTSATAAATTDLRADAARARPRAALAPGVHAAALRELGRRPQRRLADQPPAVLRRAVPGLVPRSTPTASPTTTHPLLADRGRACRSTRRRDVPAGLHRGPARRPGGFIGDPDVMDTWATSSLTPQIAGGWERDPDLFARIFPMDLRPQAHEIIRTWLFSTVVRSALRARHAAVAARRDLRLDPRPRPQEDVEVQGQRRRRRSTLLERVRLRRRALLGGERPARAPTPRSTTAR